MKTFLAIALFEMKKNINEKYTLFMFILLPIMLTFILGSTFDSFLSADIGLENKYLLYVDPKDPAGEGLKEYLEVEDIARFVQYEQVTTSEEAFERYTDEAYMGYIVLDGDAANKLYDDQPLQLTYMSKYNTEIIQGVLSGYVEAMKMYITMIDDGVSVSEPYAVSFVSRGSFNEENSFPKAIDYYAIQSLIQMLVFAAILGSNTLSRDYENDVYIRTATAPVDKGVMIGGKILGNVVYVAVAAMISLSISKIAFGANINGDFPLILLTIVMFAVIMIGIGIIIGTLVKNLVVSIGITVGLLTVFSGVSGGMTPEATNPVLQLLTPNYYAKNIIFGTIYNYDVRIINQSILAMFVGIIIVYTVAIGLQRRKQA